MLVLSAITGCGIAPDGSTEARTEIINSSVTTETEETSYAVEEGLYRLVDEPVVLTYGINSRHLVSEIPYLLIQNGNMTIVLQRAVSYMPGGQIERNGNRVKAEGQFCGQELTWSFVAVWDDTLRFDPESSHTGEYADWTDGMLFCRVRTLQETFPDYYELDARNGLDVVVWQMAKDSYSFGLLSHSDAQRERLDRELLSLKGANLTQMRSILGSYSLSPENIYIVPWANPVSSYIADLWLHDEDGETVADPEDYVRSIRSMLID